MKSDKESSRDHIGTAKRPHSSDLKTAGDAEQSVQSSAQSYLEYAVLQAKDYYTLVGESEAEGLNNAMYFGRWFESARKAGKWPTCGPLLRKLFKKGKTRNAYNYIQIFKNWEALGPARKQNPHLSIDGALRYIRTGSIEKKKKPFDPVEFESSREWSRIRKETWDELHPEEREWLKLDPAPFKRALQEARIEHLKIHVPRKEWGQYLGPRELKAVREKERQARRDRQHQHFLAQQEGIDMVADLLARGFSKNQAVIYANEKMPDKLWRKHVIPTQRNIDWEASAARVRRAANALSDKRWIIEDRQDLRALI